MTRIDEKPINHGRDHLPEGPDPIPGLPVPVGNDVDDIIRALPGLAAFWKLNESTGTIAYDSSPNDHDLQPGGGLTAPTWQQEDAPPGEPSALFATGNVDGLNDNANVAMSAFTNNFTAGIWAKFDNIIQIEELIGQGQGGHSAAGWTLAKSSARFRVLINGDFIESDNDISSATWYFIACVRDAGTFKLYVDGLVQSDTMTTSFTGSSSTWIGNDNFASHTTYLRNGLAAYGFMVDDALTSAEILEIYEAGFSGGAVAAGKVWTSNGAGSASWEYPTIEVEY